MLVHCISEAFGCESIFGGDSEQMLLSQSYNLNKNVTNRNDLHG